MTAPIRLRVYGEPVPQGSKKAFRIKGTNRAAVVDDNAAGLKSWRDGIATKASEWRERNGGMPLDEPVCVVATFWLSKPKSIPKWRWLPWTKPDGDKLLRALLDALTAIVIADDARVTDFAVRKRYAIAEPPGVDVVVIPLGETERNGPRQGEWETGWMTVATTILPDLAGEAVAQ